MSGSGKRINGTVHLRSEFVRFPKPEYIWGSLVRRRAVNIFWGDPGSGKSYVAEKLSEAVSAGLDEFLGEKVRARLRTLYMTLEDPEADAERACLDSYLDEALENWWFAFTGKCAIFGSDPEAFAVEYIDPYGIGLVVLDSFAAGSGVNDENSSSESQKVYNFFTYLARTRDLTVIIIHHISKANNRDVVSGRGSTAGPAAASSVLSFSQWYKDNEQSKRKEPTGIFYIEQPKNRTGPHDAKIGFRVTDYGLERLVTKSEMDAIKVSTGDFE